MSALESVTTLAEFLNQIGAKYRVFDLGRRVSKLSTEQFQQFELANQVYPYPFQRQALLGLIFWLPAAADRQYVWFLRFPLDEQGLLIQASRDEFLVMLLERVGASILAAAKGGKLEGVLQDSPFVFSPRDDKMAAFHAKARATLKLPASSHYNTALQYFTTQDTTLEWQNMAMQGVADVAVRLDDDKHCQGLIKRLPSLPMQPLQMLCSFLEHARPPVRLVEQLVQLIDLELQQSAPDFARLTACLRAISNSEAMGLIEHAVQVVLKHPCSVDVEILAVISGRLWPILKLPDLCQLYVEQLAVNSAGQAGFSHLLADLMFLPDMRDPVMQALRNPQRSAALTVAVGQMFGHSA